MARVHQTSRQSEEDRQAQANALDRGYVTDGRTLFHVERTLFDEDGDELLVELEDCATLELIVCSAHLVAGLGMRPVQPRAGDLD